MKPFRYDWQIVYWDAGRHYMAKVSDVLTLDVFRRLGGNIWQWVVIGYDVSLPDMPLVVRQGTAGTMKEAKVYAEQQIGNPQKAIWPAAEPTGEVPF
jgi:hypothetical protein